MASAPDFRELASAHGIELDADASMLRLVGSDAEYFGATARDSSGAYWMLKAPRRGDVQAQSRHEKRVLDHVRGRVPVVIPDWQVHTDKLIAYRVLPGIPAAEIDPLRSDGERLADALEAAGVEVTYHAHDGVTHEFFGMAAVVKKAAKAQAQAARALKAGLAAPSLASR